MCASQSAFDCISWSRLIAYHSFAGLLGHYMSEAFISAYKRFTLFSFAFFVVVVVVVVFAPFLKQARHFGFQSYGGA